jgi:Arylsulfotransferase (ASST)
VRENTARGTGHQRRHAPLATALLATVLLAAAVCTAAAACSSAPGPGDFGPPSAGPPPVTILTRSADPSGGDIFIAPMGGGYASGPEILSDTGRVIWFHALPRGTGATDFRTQTYLGQPVLTWFQAASPSTTADYIYNDRYQQIATVRAANGYETDFHEFLITPWNTALILADDRTTANLTSIGGPSHQAVIDGVVQEIDIKTGRLLFQWNSADHVPYADSHLPRPSSASQVWDWFHINAVHLDTDGNLLIDARNTWTTYKVDLRTGAIMWELGGKQSSFSLEAAPGQVLDKDGEIFSWQHDPEALGGGLYTWFDDESPNPNGGSLLGHSRAVTVRLDLATHVATLIKSDNQPEGLVAGVEGNAQTMPDGNLFVGWGALPYISEFSPSGTLLFNAQFPHAVSTYRAYRLPWPPTS